MKRLTPLLLLAPLLACGPLVMIPGGELSGSLKSAPDDWSFSDSVETVQLETRPSDPYSVNVWGVAAGADFYIASGKAKSKWASNIAEDPNVRLKLGESIYELRAERTEDAADRDAFLAAVKLKYDFEPDSEERSEAVLFKLVER